jgi:hypothetical protein
MVERRFRGSGFDMLPLGDPVDLAAVAADDALIDALSGRTPGAVPRGGDPVAELLAAWAADARRDLPASEALSAPVIRTVPVVRPPPVTRQPQRQSCPVDSDLAGCTAPLTPVSPRRAAHCRHRSRLMGRGSQGQPGFGHLRFCDTVRTRRIAVRRDRRRA